MQQKYPNSIFSKVTFPLNKDEVKWISTTIEKLTFSNRQQENPHEFEIRKYLVRKWVFLCKSYDNIPSVTASEKFIRHYTKDSEFKREIEEIMQLSLKKDEAFEKTVAFAILNLANSSDNTRVFKQLFSALTEFLSRVDAQQKNWRIFSIASSIINKFSVHIPKHEGTHRLLILDFVRFIIDGIAYKAKLKPFLPKNVSVLKLNAKELKQYQAFVDELDKTDKTTADGEIEV